MKSTNRRGKDKNTVKFSFIELIAEVEIVKLCNNEIGELKKWIIMSFERDSNVDHIFFGTECTI